jgi:hypothetical protein
MLCSCGFTPVYKKTTDSASGVTTDDMAAIDITIARGLNEQAFQTNLENLLNPTSKSVPTKYLLEVKLSKSETPLLIEQDRTITRYKISVSAQYKLINITDGKVLSEGTTHRDGGYDKVASDYATYVSSDDTTKRIIRELAADTKLKIISALRK